MRIKTTPKMKKGARLVVHQKRNHVWGLIYRSIIMLIIRPPQSPPPAKIVPEAHIALQACRLFMFRT